MSNWLTIPKNSIGAKEYIEGVDFSDNLHSVEISDDEISRMIIDGTVSKINMKCDIFIDSYESATIPEKFISSVIQLVDKIKYPTFYEALVEAQINNTYLAVDL